MKDKIASEIHRLKGERDAFHENWTFFRSEAATLRRWTFASCFTLNAGGIVGALNAAGEPKIGSAILFLLGLLSSITFVVRLANQMGALAVESRRLNHAMIANVAASERLKDAAPEDMEPSVTRSLIEKSLTESEKDRSEPIDKFSGEMDRFSTSIVGLSLFAFASGVTMWLIT